MQMATEQGGSGGARDPLAGTAYAATEVLGRGAHGTVYAARHRRLGKRVCVKLVHAGLADNRETVDRMRIEAQAMAELDGHPNLLTVSDLGETPSGQPFLVTERLHGRTLAEEWKARGEIDVDEAVSLVLDLLAGIGAAHRLGIVHRDIKPANLFVCDPRPGDARRTLKVLDFGIAKMMAAAPAARAIAPAAVPTEAGVAIGTPRYFAPEQATGMHIDARADLHAVGAVLYGLVAGRGPFDAYTDLSELVRAIAFHTPAPPSAHARQTIPTWLDHVILRALHKRPEHRFQSAEEMAEALRIGIATQSGRWARTQVLEDLPPRATPAPTSAVAPTTAVAPSVTRVAEPTARTNATPSRSPRARRARRAWTGKAVVAFFIVSVVASMLLTAWRAFGAS